MTERKEFKVDPSWKGVIKWGGVSLFAAGFILVIFVLIVFISKQTLPVPAKEALEDPVTPATLFLLAAIGELLLMPGFLGLYFSLKDVKKTPMFIATGLLFVAVPMFLASRGLIISFSQISGRYMETTNETMKAAYLASAELALETQNIYATMGLILLCVASIIVGLVMLKGVFGKRIGYLVIAAGILTIFPPVGLALMAIWQLIVGVKLYKLGKTA